MYTSTGKGSLHRFVQRAIVRSSPLKRSDVDHTVFTLQLQVGNANVVLLQIHVGLGICLPKISKQNSV